MANYIINAIGTRLAIRTLQVRPNQSTKKITTRLLDGSHTVQQVGNVATQLEVTVQVNDKTELDAICASCEQITVYHYDAEYTGIISSDDIAWAPVMPGNRFYTGTFTVMVVSVA